MFPGMVKVAQIVCPCMSACSRDGPATRDLHLQAAVRLIGGEETKKAEVLLAISGTSLIILSWSCAMKWNLAKVLQSSALRKDAITSGACATMAAMILISTTIKKSHPRAKFLDSVVAIVISFVLTLLGIVHWRGCM
jgi:divalent metal cation (Fe/Co/Zn/Cd) transporter